MKKRARVRQKHGYIYLIWEVGTNKYKIGKTVNLERRLAQLQTGASGELKIRHSIWVLDMSQTESILHRQFADRRIRKNNEWFIFPQGEYAAIAAMNNLKPCYRPRGSKPSSILNLRAISVAIGILLGMCLIFSQSLKQQPKSNQQHPTHQLKKQAG